jgi:O-antigen/teichoic acid export membrane protein
LKNIFKDFIGKSVVYGLGSSLNGLVGFLLIPFFVNHLRAGEYGHYALAEMSLNLVLVILGLGLHIVLLSRYPTLDSGKRVEMVGILFGFMLVSTIAIESVVAAIYFLDPGLIFSGIEKELFLLVVFISGIETVWLLFATLYRAEGAAVRYILYSLMQLGVGLVATVGLIVGLGYREEGILYGRLFGNLVLIGFLIPQMSAYRPRFNWKYSVEMLKVGLPMVPATFSTMWVSMSPRYFINMFATSKEVGIFTMSAKVAGIVSLLFIQPFSMAWMVAIFNIYKLPDAKKIYARMLTYYMLAGIMLATMVSIAAPGIVDILGKKTFPISSDVIIVMALAYVGYGLMYPVNIGPYVKENIKSVLPSYIFSIFISIVFGYACTYYWGPIGACIALLITYLLQSFMILRVSQSMYAVKFEWVRITKILASAFISLILLKRLVIYLPSFGVWLLPFLHIIVVAIFLLLLRFPDEEDINMKNMYLRDFKIYLGNIIK